MAHFGQFIRGLRKSKGLTQEKMAGKLGIRRGRYCDLEKIEDCFGTGKLAKVASAVGFDVEIRLIDKEDKGNAHIFTFKSE